MEKGFDPQPKRDDGALRARNANARAEDVVSVALDAPQDLEIDASHNLGSHEAASVFRRQMFSGAAIVAVCAIALEPKQLDDLRCEPARSQIVLADAESFEIFGWKVDASADEVRADIPDDVGQLKRQPQVLSVGLYALIAIAKDLDTDESNSRGNSTAVLDQRGERLVADVPEIHLHTFNQLLEPCGVVGVPL